MFKRPLAILSQSNGVPIKLLMACSVLFFSAWNTAVLAQQQLSLSFDLTQPTCAGLGVGSKIVCKPAGGTSPYTFVWSTGATSAEVSGLKAGSYTVTVTDAANRSISGTATLSDPERIDVTFESQSCSSPATIKATGKGGFPPYTYTWDGMIPGQTYTATQPGKYCVTVVDTKLCGKIACFTVSINPMVLNISSRAINCPGVNDGSASVSVSGGTAPYMYSWSNGATTSAISNLAPGTYTVTVMDAGGCSSSATTTLGNKTPIQIVLDPSNPLCAGDLNGSISASASGGNGGFIYRWSTGATTNTVAGLAAGSYSVTVTDNRGCTANSIGNILPGSNLVVKPIGVPVSCPGNNDGFALVETTGGVSPLSYQWAVGGSTNTISRLAPGTYRVTVSDAKGCRKIADVVVPAATDIVINVSSTNNITCGDVKGTAKVKATGGIGPYTYLWSNGASTDSLSKLPSGTYRVTVTDKNGCQKFGVTTITEPPSMELTLSVKQIDCTGERNGRITALVSGGTAPFTYVWSNRRSTQTIDTLAPGTYGVIVRDAKACVVQSSATLLDPPTISAELKLTDFLCGNATNGTGQITVSGGTTPYTYRWSNGATTSSIQNLGLGAYSVTVTDARNCSKSFNGEIKSNSGIKITAVKADVNCNGENNGRVVLNATGGGGTLTYRWSNGNTTSTLNNLAPGTYRVTVSDQNNCGKDTSFVITQPEVLRTSMSGQAIVCGAPNTGSARCVVTGGTQPYTYRWSNNANTSAISQLNAGLYRVTVTDARECQVIDTFRVRDAGAVLCEIVVTKGVSVPSAADGEAEVRVRGGTAPYTYRWSNNATTSAVKSLSGGSYSVTATDANGCSTSCTISLTPNKALIGDMVWFDTDEDGIMDPGEPGVPGIKVILNRVDRGATSMEMTTTGANGKYTFVVDPGCYKVTFALPDTLRPTIPNAGNNDAFDSDCNIITYMTDTFCIQPGSSNLNWDAGVTRSPRSSTLGTCQCLNNATDANTGHFRERISIDALPGETWRIVAAQGVFRDDSPNPPAAPLPITVGTTLATSSPGIFSLTFRHIDARGYTLRVTNGVDTMIFRNTCSYPTISITRLRNTRDTFCVNAAPFVLEATSSVPGEISFTLNGRPVTSIDPSTLAPGTYELIARLAPNSVDQCEAVLRRIIVITTQNCRAIIGDFVWEDRDQDGIQDPGEPGIPGVKIIILVVPKGGLSTPDTIVTDADGKFLYTGPAGQYKLTIILPPGYVLGKKNAGTNDLIDSDYDSTTLMTDVIILDDGEIDLSVDAGLIKPCVNLTDAGVIGYDQKLCGPGADPARLVNVKSPSGAPGEIEYLWMKSTSSARFDMAFFDPIPNSNAPEYDPGPVQSTTYFARCVRIKDQNCPYIENNVVTIEVGDAVKIDWKSPTGFCVKTNAVLRVETNTQNPGVRWDFAEGVSPRVAYGKVATVSLNITGNFGVTVTVSENNCVGSLSTFLTVTDNPTLCGGGVNNFNLDATPMNEKTVRLNWAVPNDGQSYTFDVQRSKDAKQFDLIGTVKEPLRIRDGNQEYEYVDYAALRGINLYRVRMLSNAFGGETFSKMANTKVGVDAQALFNVYPNPVKDRLVIQFLQENTQNITLELFSADGRLRSSKTLASGALLDGLVFDDLAPGFYFVKINMGDLGTEVVKVVKE
jgi:hypothetical protein